MSYEAERYAITTFLRVHDWFGLSPFGLDGEAIDAVAGGGYMTLLPGAAAQRSIGAPGANLHEYAGVLALTLFHDGGLGSRAARLKADDIIAAMTGLKIDETGGTPGASPALVIDFARAGAPHIAASFPEAPFLRTVINAPFIRSERI